MPIWNICHKLWIFKDHLVHFVFIWYIFPVLVSCTKKNVATLNRSTEQQFVPVEILVLEQACLHETCIIFFWKKHLVINQLITTLNRQIFLIGTILQRGLQNLPSLHEIGWRSAEKNIPCSNMLLLVKLKISMVVPCACAPLIKTPQVGLSKYIHILHCVGSLHGVDMWVLGWPLHINPRIDGAFNCRNKMPNFCCLRHFDQAPGPNPKTSIYNAHRCKFLQLQG
jgi:hypothetical protein